MSSLPSSAWLTGLENITWTIIGFYVKDKKRDLPKQETRDNDITFLKGVTIDPSEAAQAIQKIESLLNMARHEPKNLKAEIECLEHLLEHARQQLEKA